MAQYIFEGKYQNASPAPKANITDQKNTMDNRQLKTRQKTFNFIKKTMEAIKQIVKVKNDKITIHLKPEMNNTKVEVIILPFSPKKDNKESKDSGLKDLLSVGVWSDSDLTSTSTLNLSSTRTRSQKSRSLP